VARDGRLTAECPVGEYPDWIRHTVSLKHEITPESFRVPAGTPDRKIPIHVIGMVPRQIINQDILEEVPVRSGQIRCDLEKDLLKIAVVERYGKNGNVGVGFVRGFELKAGA